MSEPIIRAGDIAALSEAITQTCEAVAEVARQNTVLVEAINLLSERVEQLEGEKAALIEDPKQEELEIL